MRVIRSIAMVTTLCTLPVGQSLAATCNPNVRNDAPDSRYIDNGDATVTDTLTGLTWKQCPEGRSGSRCADGDATLHTWQQALQQVQALNQAGFAGHRDWRLPNVNELASLVNHACISPSINVTYFPGTIGDNHWSSSPNPDFPDQAWVVDFAFGNVDHAVKGDGFPVRLVRDHR